MSFKIDLHVHSQDSGDNDADPEETVLRAIELGLDGIAFTEHYTFAASEHAERLKEKYAARILVLRGVELSTVAGHCLVFGADTDRLGLRDLPVEEVVRRVNAAGGAAIPSHPYRSVNSIGDRILTLPSVCALEGYNGCNMYAFNQRAIETSRQLGLPYTGGSDAHASADVGSCYTEFQERVSAENVVALLKKGQYRGVDTRKISKIVLL